MVPQTLNLGNSMKYLFSLGNTTDATILFRDMPYCLPLFFPCQTVCWCLFLLLLHGSSWTWNGKLAFKSIRAGYCWQSAMAILDVPEPQNLQPGDVINLLLLAIDWMFLGKCVTIKLSERVPFFACGFAAISSMVVQRGDRSLTKVVAGAPPQNATSYLAEVTWHSQSRCSCTIWMLGSSTRHGKGNSSKFSSDRNSDLYSMCPMRRNVRRKPHNLTIILEPKKAFFGIRWTRAMQSQIWLKSTQPGTQGYEYLTILDISFFRVRSCISSQGGRGTWEAGHGG